MAEQRRIKDDLRCLHQNISEASRAAFQQREGKDVERQQQNEQHGADALQYGADIQLFIGDALAVVQEGNADHRKYRVEDKAPRKGVSRYLRQDRIVIECDVSEKLISFVYQQQQDRQQRQPRVPFFNSHR